MGTKSLQLKIKTDQEQFCYILIVQVTKMKIRLLYWLIRPNPNIWGRIYKSQDQFWGFAYAEWKLELSF